MHTIIHGDCLEELKKLDDNSVDAVITDPPYGLSNTKPAQVADVLKAWVTGDTVSVPAKRGGFMGKDWDSFVPPPAVWEECMRVLKPGGHMAVFAGARTQDLMGLSIRLAGFEIRDTLGWVYGSGFPKSMDISKAIDKGQGKNRQRQLEFTEWMRSTGITAREINEATGTSQESGHLLAGPNHSQPHIATADMFDKLRPLLPEVPERIERLVAERTGIEWTDYVKREVVGKHKSGLHTGPSGVGGHGEGGAVTAPATSEAQRWDGWGTALKPAIEPIILARKPLDGTVANNVLAHGVGGLNIDACRVGNESRINLPAGNKANSGGVYKFSNAEADAFNGAKPAEVAGRFPANVLLDEHAAKEMDKQSGITKDGTHVGRNRDGSQTANEIYAGPWKKDTRDIGYGGEGGASRFFPVFKSEEETPETKGRFPVNVLLDEHAAAEMDKQSGVLKSGGGNKAPRSSTSWFTSNSPNVDDVRNPDSGGASRFFPVFKYQAKAPKKERPVIYKNNCECEEWQLQQKDTTGSIATVETSWSMSTSGNSTTEKCQQDTTSTTSTMTSSTTGSKTSNALAGSTISESTQDAKSEMANGGNHAESAESLNQSAQNTGISAKRGGRSTDDAGHATSKKWYTTSECEKCGEPRLKVQHATVKPLALMEWLVSLIVPPNGVVLDPFAGSGTTLQAAVNKGFTPIGIEADADYIQLIHQRMEGGTTSTRSS